MKKKLIILVLAIILLVIIIVLTKNMKPVPVENPNNTANYQSVEEEINSIDVNAGIDEDMKSIDADLENL